MANGVMRAWDGTQWVTLPAASQNPGSVNQAVNVNFTPAGDIVATNVQTAIQEVDSEKAKLAGDAAQAFSASTLTAATGNITNVNSTQIIATDVRGSSFNSGSILGRTDGIINGSFDKWSLGSSITVTGHLQKIADRWNYDFNGTLGTINISKAVLSSDLWPLPGNYSPKNTARLICSVAPTGNTFQDFSTQLESVTSYAGKQITISFYALSLAASEDVLIKTEQYFGGGGSPSAPVFNTSSPISVSNTVFQRHSVTFTMASVTSKILGSNGDDTMNVILTLPLNKTFDLLVGGFQIDEGPLALPYRNRSFSQIESECNRYLVSSYTDGTVPGSVTSEGVIAFTQSSANSLFTIQLPSALRTIPVVTLYNPTTGAVGTWNNAGTSVAVSVNTNGTRNITIALSGGTAGNFCTGHYVVQDPYY